MTTVRCPHFGVCGGCSILDQPYEEQIKTKQIWVRNALNDVSPQRFHPVGPSPEYIFYRNKMEFSFGDGKDIEILNSPEKSKKPAHLSVPSTLGTVHVGLHPKKRWSLVVPTFQCQLQSPQSQKITQIISAWATKNKIPVYLRKNHTGVLRHVVIREGKNTGERMVNIFTTDALPGMDDLAPQLKEPHLGVTTLIWTINNEKSDATQGEIKKIFWGQGIIREKSGSVYLNVAPTAFLQTNTHAFEKMLEQLKEWISQESKQAHLYDLYCGCGTIGLELASQFESVLGVESNPATIKEAEENATLNKIKNASFISGRVEDHLDALKNRNAVVVVDPPRNGLHPRVVQALLALAAPTIYYVSCNRDALARDLRLLQAKYRISDVKPMDFFPHTDHVEILVRLKLK